MFYLFWLEMIKANIRIASYMMRSEHEERIGKVIKCVILEFKKKL